MPATAETATYAVYISNYFNGTREIKNETVMQTIPMDDDEIENSLISGVVKAEMGKAGSFEFSIPIGHPFYNALQPMRTMIRVEFYGAEIFRGRVLTVGKEMYGTRAVHCEGAFAFFLDSHQEGSKEETRTEITVLQYLERLINNHNADVAESWKRVMLGDVPGNYASYVLDEQKVAIPADKAKQKFGNTSWDTTMDRLEDLLNQFGGYFRLRPVKEGEYYSGDLTQVGMTYVPDGGTGLSMLSSGGLTARGEMSDAEVIQKNHDTKETFGAVLDWYENYYTNTPNQHLGDNIAAGKNLLDLKGETTVDNLFTVLIPIGKKNSDDVFIADYWPTAYEGHAKVNYIEVPELVTKNLYTDAQLTAHPFHKVSEYENAISKYGRIYKIMEFENANTPEKLFNYAKEWIKENYTPELIQWDVTALDLRIINSAHPAIFVGDRIGLTHPEVVTTYSSFTVISAEYVILNPEKNKYKIGIPNQTINASYGVKNKKSKKTKPDGPSSATPPGGDPEEIKEELDKLKAQLQQRYSLKTDWNQNITYDDPLAFTVFETNGNQLSAKDAAKKMGSIITELMRTKVTKAGELLTQALQRGCAKDDVQLLIDNTPSVKSMQNAWKGATQTYMVGQLGMTSQEAEVLTNESAGSSWLAALVDDDGNWSQYAISKGYAGAGNAKLKQQAIATRKILNGTETPPGANVIQNTVDQVVGNNLFMGNFLQADSDTESMGIGNDGEGGWDINLNLPFSYDLDGHTYNIPSGTVSAKDFNIHEVPSFATKFAMIDDLIANCVTTNELNAALARIGTIEARYVTAESMKTMNINAKDFVLYGYHLGNISLKNALKSVFIRNNGDGTNTLMYLTMLDTQPIAGETFSSATPLSAAWSSESEGGVENVYTVGSKNANNEWIGTPKTITIRHLMGHIEDETFVSGNSETTGSFWHKVGSNYLGAVQIYASDSHVVETIPILGIIPYQGGQQSVTVGSLTWASDDAKQATIHLNGNNNTGSFKIDHLLGHMENGAFTTTLSAETNSVWGVDSNDNYTMAVQIYCTTDGHVLENIPIFGTIPYNAGYAKGFDDAGVSAGSVTIKPLTWTNSDTAVISLNGSPDTKTIQISHLEGHIENGTFTTSNSSTTNSVWHKSGSTYSMAVQIYCPTDGHVIENVGILGTIPYQAGVNSVTVSSVSWTSGGASSQGTGTISLNNNATGTVHVDLRTGHAETGSFVAGNSSTTNTIWYASGNNYSTAVQAYDPSSGSEIRYITILGTIPYNAGRNSVSYRTITWDDGTGTISLNNSTRTGTVTVTLRTGHAESGSFVNGTSDTTGTIWYRNGTTFSTAVQAYDSSHNKEIKYTTILGVVPYNAGKEDGWSGAYDSITVTGSSQELAYGGSATITVKAKSTPDGSAETIKTITIRSKGDNHDIGGATANVSRGIIASATSYTELEYNTIYTFTPFYTDANGDQQLLTSKTMYCKTKADRYNTGWNEAYGKVSIPTTANSSSASMSVSTPAQSPGTADPVTNTFTVSADDTYAYIKNSSGTILARYTHNQYSTGWGKAYNQVSIPTAANTTVSMSITTPGATSGKVTTSFSVSADDTYAYIKNSAGTVLARYTHNQYNSGFDNVTLGNWEYTQPVGSANSTRNQGIKMSCSNKSNGTARNKTLYIKLKGGDSFNSSHKCYMYIRVSNSDFSSDGAIIGKAIVDGTAVYDEGVAAGASSATAEQHNSSLTITRAQTGTSTSGVPTFTSGTLYYFSENDGKYHAVANSKYWYYSSTAISGSKKVYY